MIIMFALDEFESMCNKHDFSYNMSDDHTVWRNGIQSLYRLKQFVKDNGITPFQAMNIFNRACERKFISGAELFFTSERDWS